MIFHSRTVEQTIDRHERATFVKELVVTGGSLPLAMVRKRAAWEAGTRAPVLLVHGFGQNRYAWHLPSRSLANRLASAGFDVFNLDLRGHGRSRHLGARGARSVYDYVREDLPAAIEEVQKQSGARKVWLVGHSLGGLVSYAAAPGLEGAVAGVASIGSPYHFTRGSLSLRGIAMFFHALTRLRVPKVNVGVSVKPIGALMSTFRRVSDTKLYPLLRGWHTGALEPHVLEEHLRLAFDRAGFGELRNMFEWANEKRFGDDQHDYAERFEKLDVPLLVVAGANDDLAPPEGVKPAFLRSQSSDKTYKSLPLGHIDLLVGRDAPLMTWPLVEGWISKRAA